MAIDDFDCIVIGAGMMGSAAARYLAEGGRRVAIVGPAEPQDYRTHAGVFASHYDQARLTYRVSHDALWSYLGISSIARYAEIEARSGIRFHKPVGKLAAYSAAEGGTRAGQARQMAAELAVPLSFYPPGDTGWMAHGPGLCFPVSCSIVYEAEPAGYVNPRLLVQAQLAIARQHGAVLIREEARAVEERSDHVAVAIPGGRTIVAGQVLVAAGAFTNFNGLLPLPIPLRIKTETIVLGRLPVEVGERLARLPVVVYEIEDEEISEVYMTPPVLYPDGQYYTKLGANTIADHWPESPEEIGDWFRRGDSDRCLPALERALRAILPGAPFTAVRSARCVVCYTPSRAPTIDHVAGSDRILVAAGGNGMGAKGSDCCGRLAARLMLGDEWPAELPRQPFLLRP